ncbi:uncharacterized protein JCM6883_005715 [Sporobolomyces salmoneus]|uniref:uncharacterized protein n=1 Tax=Sporobolomyces salmoneus TaxID=183962 RepID=UPI003178B348
MSDVTAELLAILSRVEPLLLPDLPSPPPSPSLPHVNGHSNGHSTKRKLEEESEDISDSKRSRPPPRPPAPAPPRPPAPPPSIDLKPPTPEFRQSRLPPPPPPPAASSSSNTFKSSPRLNGNASLASNGEAEWRKDWPKERLRKLGAQCRDHGRRLKHSGDSLARRSNSPQTILLSLAHQLDAILLYVFSFWCDDTASKTCLSTNWSSVFGLIGFVKKAAEKENQQFLIGICLRMEAIAIYTLSMHEQKALFYKATQISQSSASTTASSSRPLPPRPPPPPAPAPSTSTTTNDHSSPASSSSNSITAASPASQSLPLSHPSPSSSAPLPPGPPPPPPPAPAPSSSSNSLGPRDTPSTSSHSKGNPSEIDGFLKQFLRASPELFRFQKLYDESCVLLLASHSSSSPTSYSTSELILPNPSSSSSSGGEEGELNSDEAGATIEAPIELARGTGSVLAGLMVPSQVRWGRGLLEKWTREKGLDFEFCRIGQAI